jgi:hypothetical protein
MLDGDIVATAQVQVPVIRKVIEYRLVDALDVALIYCYSDANGSDALGYRHDVMMHGSVPGYKLAMMIGAVILVFVPVEVLFEYQLAGLVDQNGMHFFVLALPYLACGLFERPRIGVYFLQGTDVESVIDVLRRLISVVTGRRLPAPGDKQ